MVVFPGAGLVTEGADHGRYCITPNPRIARVNSGGIWCVVMIRRNGEQQESLYERWLSITATEIFQMF